MNAPPDLPHVNERCVKEFVALVHKAAAAAFDGISAPGMLSLVRIHPDEQPPKPVAYRFKIGDIDGMVGQALADARGGFNVYVEARTVRPGLSRSQRGTAVDTVGVFALIIDDDRAKGKDGESRLPPSFIVASSDTGNRHLWHVFDHAVPYIEAAAIGAAMRTSDAGGDTATGKPDQIYRVAGTPNFPDRKKRTTGRGASSTAILEASGTVFSAAEIAAAYPPSSKQGHAGTGAGQARPVAELLARLSTKRRADLADPSAADRSGHFFKVTGWLKGDGFTAGEAEALWRAFPEGAGMAKYVDGRATDELARWTADAWAKASDVPPDGFDASGMGAGERSRPHGEEGKAKSCGRLIDLGEPRPFSPPPELIRDTLPPTGVAIVGGQSGALKSFGCLQLGVCITTGEPFAGRKIERPGGVVYIAAEGEGTIEGRMVARRTLLADPDQRLPFLMLCGIGPISDRAGYQRLEAELENAKKLLRVRYGSPLVAFIIDTVAAAGMIAEDKEADSGAWQKVFDGLKPISERLNALALIVHHAGKNPAAGLRGSSNNRAGADAVLMFSCDRDEITGLNRNHALALTKSRSAPEGPIGMIHPRPVVIGHREDGTEVTSLVLEIDTGTKVVNVSKREMRKPTRAFRAFREAFFEALGADGEMQRVHGVADGPQVKAVQVAHVRDAFARLYVTSGDDERKRRDLLRKQFGARRAGDRDASDCWRRMARNRMAMGTRGQSGGPGLRRGASMMRPCGMRNDAEYSAEFHLDQRPLARKGKRKRGRRSDSAARLLFLPGWCGTEWNEHYRDSNSHSAASEPRRMQAWEESGKRAAPSRPTSGCPVLPTGRSAEGSSRRRAARRRL